MKSLALTLVVLASFNAFADDDVVISQGLRVSLSKTLLSARLSAGNDSVTQNVDQIVGFGLDFVSIKEHAAGFTLGLHADQLTHSVNLAKAEANMTYGFARQTYVFGGVNVATVEGAGTSVNPGLGGQLGLGVNFTSRIGADVQYDYETMRAPGTAVVLNGFEFRLHFDF